MWSIFTLIKKEKKSVNSSQVSLNLNRLDGWVVRRRKKKIRERKNPKIINNILVLDLRVGDA